MKRYPTPRLLAVIIAALCITLLAVSAFAQIQSGNIFGKVQAKDGSAIPGVTVTLTGVGAPQTTVTDAQGNFRFINLSPGSTDSRRSWRDSERRRVRASASTSDAMPMCR